VVVLDEETVTGGRPARLLTGRAATVFLAEEEFVEPLAAEA
jgi:hypothetical protein